MDDVRAALARGENVQQIDFWGEWGPESGTPLHVAAAGNRADVVRVLLDAGADVTAVDKDGRPAWRLATDSDVIALLGGDGDGGAAAEAEGDAAAHVVPASDAELLHALLKRLGGDAVGHLAALGEDGQRPGVALAARKYLEAAAWL